MNWLLLQIPAQVSVQTVARVSVERILNGLPEGLLIAFFAWALLRVLRKQNSGTRFAVWFLALLTVALLPLLGGLGEGRMLLAHGMSRGNLHSAITVPGSWALFAFIAWALGAGVAVTRLATGLWRLRQLCRSCTAVVAADLDPIVQKTLVTLGARGSAESGSAAVKSTGYKSITVATSEEVRVPSAIGFWQRTIVLPAWALRELPPEDLNVILLHEFAHLRRGDDWTNLIQKIVRAIFFFHPAVWWIENRLSVEREMACDDAVLVETSDPRGYATCLVSLLEKSLAHREVAKPLADKRWSMAQAAVHRAREAALRLAQILDSNRPVATAVWKPALGALGVFSLVCLAVLAQAPRFVAFDRDGAGNSDHAYTAVLNQTSLPSSLRTAVRTPAIIPASFRTGESSSPSVGTASVKIRAGKTVTAMKMTAGKTTMAGHAVLEKLASAHVAAVHELAPASAIVARLNAAPPRAQVVQVEANADQELVPQFQTLVFIQATEYRGAGSSVWSVQVFRVTFLSGLQQRAMKVPVANSI